MFPISKDTLHVYYFDGAVAFRLVIEELRVNKDKTLTFILPLGSPGSGRFLNGRFDHIAICREATTPPMSHYNEQAMIAMFAGTRLKEPPTIRLQPATHKTISKTLPDYYYYITVHNISYDEVTWSS